MPSSPDRIAGYACSIGCYPMPVPRGGLPGYDVTASGSLYARLVNTYDNGIAWLRLAMAVLTVAAAALVVEQKHLLAEPGPGLVLVLVCALPFIIDAAWPHLLRPAWRLATASTAIASRSQAMPLSCVFTS